MLKNKIFYNNLKDFLFPLTNFCSLKENDTSFSLQSTNGLVFDETNICLTIYLHSKDLRIVELILMHNASSMGFPLIHCDIANSTKNKPIIVKVLRFYNFPF